MTPAVSSTKPCVALSRLTSSWREPTRPLSSPTGRRTRSSGATSGVLLQQGQQLEAAGEPGLVVGPEDRRPVGADDAVVPDDRDDPRVRAGRVHVRRHQDRALTSAGAHGHDVPDLVLVVGNQGLNLPSSTRPISASCPVGLSTATSSRKVRSKRSRSTARGPIRAAPPMEPRLGRLTTCEGLGRLDRNNGRTSDRHPQRVTGRRGAAALTQAVLAPLPIHAGTVIPGG